MVRTPVAILRVQKFEMIAGNESSNLSKLTSTHKKLLFSSGFEFKYASGFGNFCRDD